MTRPTNKLSVTVMKVENFCNDCIRAERNIFSSSSRCHEIEFRTQKALLMISLSWIIKNQFYVGVIAATPQLPAYGRQGKSPKMRCKESRRGSRRQWGRHRRWRACGWRTNKVSVLRRLERHQTIPSLLHLWCRINFDEILWKNWNGKWKFSRNSKVWSELKRVWRPANRAKRSRSACTHLVKSRLCNFSSN